MIWDFVSLEVVFSGRPHVQAALLNITTISCKLHQCFWNANIKSPIFYLNNKKNPKIILVLINRRHKMQFTWSVKFHTVSPKQFLPPPSVINCLSHSRLTLMNRSLIYWSRDSLWSSPHPLSFLLPRPHDLREAGFELPAPLINSQRPPLEARLPCWAAALRTSLRVELCCKKKRSM